MNQNKGKAPKKSLPEQMTCQKCEKPLTLCICESISAVDTKTSVLILQHPQEPDKLLGTARIANLSLNNSKLSIGLSWPNLEKAWGKVSERNDWLVLYLGSINLSKLHNIKKPALVLVDKKNNILSKNENDAFIQSFAKRNFRGIIVLDGTWSQAKTLWWRNAWLNKLQRCAVLPPSPSLYGKLRKEPKKESLSTIESIAHSLAILDPDTTAEKTLISNFKALLKKATL